MKIILSVISLAGMLLLSGCMPLKPNPEFSRCANICSNKQDACMVNASTAKGIERCNSKLDKCTNRCEGKYSRYLK